MMKAVNPEDTPRAQQYEIWKQAPNPMLVFVKKMDVTNLVRLSKKHQLKFNMLLDFCIGKAALAQREFYLLPVGDQLMQFDQIAVNTMVKNHAGGVSSCDIAFDGDFDTYNRDYLRYTREVAATAVDRDLSSTCMVIGTSAVIDTELVFAGGMYSGIYNNPFIMWGRYSRHFFRYSLHLSFQFHHTQMDGAHASAFLERVQQEIHGLRIR